MSSTTRSLVGLILLLAPVLAGCDYVVDAYKAGVEVYVTTTTTAVLNAIFPIKTIVGANNP